MSPEQQAIGALWIALQAGVLAVVRYLVAELGRVKEGRAADAIACEERVTAVNARLEVKMNETTDLIRRQAESMQKQIDAQAALVNQQQAMIAMMEKRAP